MGIDADASKTGCFELNKKFIIAGIKLLLEKNYRFESDLVDLEGLIDETLTFSENFENIKDIYLSGLFCPICGHFLR